MGCNFDISVMPETESNFVIEFNLSGGQCVCFTFGVSRWSALTFADDEERLFRRALALIFQPDDARRVALDAPRSAIHRREARVLTLQRRAIRDDGQFHVRWLQNEDKVSSSVLRCVHPSPQEGMSVRRSVRRYEMLLWKMNEIENFIYRNDQEGIKSHL